MKDAKEIFLKGIGITVIPSKKSDNKHSNQSETTNQRSFKSEETYTDEEFLQNDDYPDEDTFEYVYVKSESNDQYNNENENEADNECLIEIHDDKSVQDENKRRYECDICGRTYPKMSTLREHILSIHVGQETECELCKAK